MGLLCMLSCLLFTYLKMWAYALCLYALVPIILRVIFIFFPLKNKVDAKKDAYLEYASLDIHKRWTRPEKRFEWFSFQDCFYRYSLTTITMLWVQMTQPFKFMRYSWQFFNLHYGQPKQSLLFATFPVLPLGFLTLLIFENLKRVLTGGGGIAWQQNCPGKVFFERPANPISSFFWEMYINQSLYVYNFLMMGTNEMAVAHTLHDHETTKTVWRKHLTKVGAKVPPELAFWDGEKGQMDIREIGKKQVKKAIIKVNDGYLGGGDKIMKDFELESKDGQSKLESIFKDEYKKQRALLLEFVDCKKSMGTHSIDIVTIRQPNGKYQVLSCVIWGECGNGDTSHYTEAGFTIDVQTEKVAQKLYQYGVHFNKPGNEDWIGRHFPGCQEACQ